MARKLLCRCIATVAVAFVLSAGTEASAAPLGLHSGPPDFSGSTLFSYDALTHVFTGSGVVSGLDDGSSIFGITGGAYNLTATITDPINHIASGVLEITGGIGSMGISSGTRLLKGAITAFGYDDSVPGYGGFEFTFDVDDGALSPIFGDRGGTIIGPTNVSPAAWNFGTSFVSTGAATFDAFSVPESGSVMLLLTGIGGLVARRRWCAGKRR